MAYLIGFYFAPRIPNLTERRLYTLGPTSEWPMLTPFIGGRADEKLITAHWNDALRFASSVRTGAASASLLLKRLGAYPRQNGLALALREIGRIERTLFMLDWIERLGLRRQTTAELNKGEARNALVRAVLPPPRPLARSCNRGPAIPCERARSRHRRHRALEYHLSRPCH